MLRLRGLADGMGGVVAAWALLAAAAPASAEDSPAPPQDFQLEIRAFDIEGNTLLDELAIEKAVYPHMGPGRGRQDINAAREALENAYRAKGYQSVVVDIPAQNVSGGVVKFTVIEAPVGRLRVVGSRYNDLDRIKAQAPSLQEGQVPDLARAQREVADLNRLPDRRVTPLLKPGRTPGTIDVDLKVDDSLPLHASAELNNDYSQNTHPLRTLGTVRYTNLWQLGHSVSGTVLLAPEDVNDAEVFAGSYMAPIWGSPWSVLAFGYYSNSNVNTLGGTSVLGKGYSIGARAVLQLPSKPDLSQSLSFGADFKHFNEDVSLGGTTVEAPIEYVPFNAVYSLQLAGSRSSSSVTLGTTLGLRGFGSDASAFLNKRAFARANFVRLNLDLTHDQQLKGGWDGKLRFSGQVTDQPLVSTEQFAAGGRSTVRGYLQSEAIGDDGFVGSAELETPSFAPLVGKWVDEARLYAFVDGAKLWVLDPLPDQLSRFTLLSVGAGARIELMRHLYGDITIAVPLRDAAVTQGGDPFALFSLRSEF